MSHVAIETVVLVKGEKEIIVNITDEAQFVKKGYARPTEKEEKKADEKPPATPPKLPAK